MCYFLTEVTVENHFTLFACFLTLILEIVFYFHETYVLHFYCLF